MPRGDANLADQRSRASVSTVTNIAEGANRLGATEKRQKFSIARGEVGEAAACIELATGSRAGTSSPSPGRLGRARSGRDRELIPEQGPPRRAPVEPPDDGGAPGASGPPRRGGDACRRRTAELHQEAQVILAAVAHNLGRRSVQPPATLGIITPRTSTFSMVLASTTCFRWVGRNMYWTKPGQPSPSATPGPTCGRACIRQSERWCTPYGSASSSPSLAKSRTRVGNGEGPGAPPTGRRTTPWAVHEPSTPEQRSRSRSRSRRHEVPKPLQTLEFGVTGRGRGTAAGLARNARQAPIGRYPVSNSFNRAAPTPRSSSLFLLVSRASTFTGSASSCLSAR